MDGRLAYQFTACRRVGNLHRLWAALCLGVARIESRFLRSPDAKRSKSVRFTWLVIGRFVLSADLQRNGQLGSSRIGKFSSKAMMVLFTTVVLVLSFY